MFNEKLLLQAVKAAEKGGLALTVSGDSVYLRAQTWMAVTTWRQIREHYRALLGHIAEATGYVPKDENLTVWREKGGYTVSAVVPEVAAGEIAFFCEYDREWPVQYTGLRWDCALVQDRTGRIWRCGMRAPHLAGDLGMTDGGKVISRDEDTGEAVYEIAYRAREDSPERERNLWQHLESVAWCRWTGEDPDEIEGQYEIGEDE